MEQRDPKLDKKSSHLLLLAENQTGYQNLLQIASAAQIEGFYYHPRIDHNFLAAHSEGLICTSGCMSAEIPRMISDGRLAGAREQLDWYYDVFGAQNFFLELQSHDIDELERINKQLVDLGRRYDANFVATNDVHYITKEDARFQDILLAIQTGCLLSDPNRMRMTSNSYYLRTVDEMAAIFGEIPGALNNSLQIAERCNVDLGFKGYHLPDFTVPEGHEAESYLYELCQRGLERKYDTRSNEPIVRERLKYELDIIHQMGFDAYFLIVWDLCKYAKDRGIWYNARGSAAGSIVAYTLDITIVDPLEHGLIFERFLNPGRVSMPDIDLDFPDDRRAEMMQYTANKYGDDKVAQIITFGKLGARAAIRDVGRVMDIPLNEVDKVAKLVPNIPGKPITIEESLAEVTELGKLYKETPFLRDLIDTAQQMEGVVRNAGTHAAGVIITDKPVIEYVPVHRPTGSAAGDNPIKTVTQFEMSVLDALGLLKVDFLGLSTLTIMARACDLIHKRHGIDFDLNNIPTDDPETYELLGRGDTAGVFQVEGAGMRRWLIQMKPKTLANVIAMVALYRPGPMDFIPGYIRRMHGEEEVEYRHPGLEEIFNETYGYPVYQEQLMFAAMELAGYNASEADELRKAISKKKKNQLESHRQKFVRGAVENGIERETAAGIYSDWEEFARYGFNKSHAVDYGVIAVQTAYLKTHYAIEYMTALLSVSKNETEKVALYAADCRRMGIPVEPPNVNVSDWDFTIEDRNKSDSVIRFGLGAVKNVGQGPVEAILDGRTDGRFEDLNEFAKRVDLRKVGRRALESLIKVGALDSFGGRPKLLEAMDRIMAVSSSHFRAAESGQMSLFGAHTGVEDQIELPEVSFEISKREILNWERELIGLYVSDHPLSPVMEVIQDAVTHYSGQLAEVSPEELVKVAGIIARIRLHQTRTGKSMAFVTIEDIQGSIDLLVFPRTWTRAVDFVEIDQVVFVEGHVDNESAEPKILVNKITTEIPNAKSVNKKPVSDKNLPSAIKINPPEGKLDEPRKSQYDLEQNQRAIDPGLDKSKVKEAKGAAEVSGVHRMGEESVDGDDWYWEGMPPPPETPSDWEFVVAGLKTGDILEEYPNDPDPTMDDFPGFQEQPITNTSGITENVLESDLMPTRGPDNVLEAPIAVAPHISDSDGTLDKVDNKKVGEPKDPSLSTTLSERNPLPQAKIEGSNHLPPYLLSPIGFGEIESGEVHMVTVVLRSSGDKMRDVLRLRRIHGIMITYPGNDRFAFHIFERGRGYLLEFPNYTAGINDELLERLRNLAGTENVRVETITFQ